MNSRFVYVLLLGLIIYSQSFAQSDRTFVATAGSDTNNCTFATPCRTFAAAVTKTNALGEVIALDSGIYDGNVVVDKSLTLMAAPGAHAELSNTNNNADRILVNAGSSDVVIIRNLYLSKQPGGTGNYGIGVRAVGTLNVENCVIDGFNEGIDFFVTTAAKVFIKNTIVRNSVASGIVFYTSGSNPITASIEESSFVNNGSAGVYHGVSVTRKTRVSIRKSVASGNTGAGFYIQGGEMTLDDCESFDNDEGVVATGNLSTSGRVIVSNSIVTHNAQYGFRQTDSGVFQSLGNNVVRRNGTNTIGTITVITGT